jgi:hypothetical protein
MKYFYITKPVDRCTGPVDHDRVMVHGSVVDHGRQRPKGSSEHGLKATAGVEACRRWGKRERKPRGFLPWVRVGGAVPEGGRRQGCDGGGDLLSTTSGSGRGETRVGADLNTE